jgi:hypothetical protein
MNPLWKSSLQGSEFVGRSAEYSAEPTTVVSKIVVLKIIVLKPGVLTIGVSQIGAHWQFRKEMLRW